MLAGPSRNRSEKAVGETVITERTTDVFANFVAASAYGRAQGNDNIGRIAAELFHHPGDDLLQEAEESSFPAAVRGSDDALFFVYKKDGKAIGCLDDQKEPGQAGNHGVAPGGYIRNVGDDMDSV